MAAPPHRPTPSTRTIHPLVTPREPARTVGDRVRAGHEAGPGTREGPGHAERRASDMAYEAIRRAEAQADVGSYGGHAHARQPTWSVNPPRDSQAARDMVMNRTIMRRDREIARTDDRRRAYDDMSRARDNARRSAREVVSRARDDAFAPDGSGGHYYG